MPQSGAPIVASHKHDPINHDCIIPKHSSETRIYKISETNAIDPEEVAAVAGVFGSDMNPVGGIFGGVAINEMG